MRFSYGILAGLLLCDNVVKSFVIPSTTNGNRRNTVVAVVREYDRTNPSFAAEQLTSRKSVVLASTYETIRPSSSSLSRRTDTVEFIPGNNEMVTRRTTTRKLFGRTKNIGKTIVLKNRRRKQTHKNRAMESPISSPPTSISSILKSIQTARTEFEMFVHEQKQKLILRTKEEATNQQCDIFQQAAESIVLSASDDRVSNCLESIAPNHLEVNIIESVQDLSTSNEQRNSLGVIFNNNQKVTNCFSAWYHIVSILSLVDSNVLDNIRIQNTITTDDDSSSIIKIDPKKYGTDSLAQYLQAAEERLNSIQDRLQQSNTIVQNYMDNIMGNVPSNIIEYPSTPEFDTNGVVDDSSGDYERYDPVTIPTLLDQDDAPAPFVDDKVRHSVFDEVQSSLREAGNNLDQSIELLLSNEVAGKEDFNSRIESLQRRIHIMDSILSTCAYTVDDVSSTTNLQIVADNTTTRTASDEIIVRVEELDCKEQTEEMLHEIAEPTVTTRIAKDTATRLQIMDSILSQALVASAKGRTSLPKASNICYY